MRSKKKTKELCYNCNKPLHLKNKRCSHCGIRYVDITDTVKDPFILVTKCNNFQGQEFTVKTKVMLKHNQSLHPYGLEVDSSFYLTIDDEYTREALLHMRLLPVHFNNEKILFTITIEEEEE